MLLVFCRCHWLGFPVFIVLPIDRLVDYASTVPIIGIPIIAGSLRP
jgi:hypothetical protein